MLQIDIYLYPSGMWSVAVTRDEVPPRRWRTKGCAQYDHVTRSSLIRAQRMQLKLYDQMKGQSPDDSQTA